MWSTWNLNYSTHIHHIVYKGDTCTEKVGFVAVVTEFQKRNKITEVSKNYQHEFFIIENLLQVKSKESQFSDYNNFNWIFCKPFIDQ